MAEKKADNGEAGPIQEGWGRFPWWIWPIIVGWLIYAFIVAPFEVTHP